MLLTFDHLAVASTSLSQGVKHIQQQLSVTPPFGGEHAVMNTHNHLMKLGHDEFLEVISINPASPAPGRPRWFALDAFKETTPRLLTWVARTDDLDAALHETRFINWRSLSVSRGKLRWKIAVPDDGSLPFNGAFPTIIEWPKRPFPGASMADFDCSLIKLHITHPEADNLRDLLFPLIDNSRLSIQTGETTRLSATIDTPDGKRTLA